MPDLDDIVDKNTRHRNATRLVSNTFYSSILAATLEPPHYFSFIPLILPASAFTLTLIDEIKNLRMNLGYPLWGSAFGFALGGLIDETNYPLMYTVGLIGGSVGLVAAYMGRGGKKFFNPEPPKQESTDKTPPQRYYPW
ncbi:hypothetical protein HY488_00475 [Candidatus Woesearchaeota archaeon]|nr:hypothetical protein [Candidatus Woesearchaeota archaeon]